MERIEQGQRQPTFDFSQIARRLGENDRSFIANILLAEEETGKENVVTNYVEQTPWSKFNDETGEVTIGIAPLPENARRLWGWGTTDPAMENFLKLLHENSHAFQKTLGLKDSLCRWLDPPHPSPEDPRHIAFVELYEIFKTLGRVNGLSTMGIYETQSQETGNLSMSVLEDVTETMAAYSLGEDYLHFRLDNGSVSLTPSTKSMILERLRTVFGG